MRLIDADALLDRLIRTPRYFAVKFDIEEAPTVDAVPVVRCKDCKYWQDNNGGYPHPECRWGRGETPDEDDFCSCGERRTDE